jgi:hypothetical protein
MEAIGSRYRNPPSQALDQILSFAAPTLVKELESVSVRQLLVTNLSRQLGNVPRLRPFMLRACIDIAEESSSPLVSPAFEGDQRVRLREV